MQNRDNIPRMPRHDAAEVWAEITDDVASLDAEDRVLSDDDRRWCADMSAFDALMAQAEQRVRTSVAPTFATGSMQPLHAELMGMDRTALVARFALAVRTRNVAPPIKPLDALSDDELRQFLLLVDA